ncbi:MAG: hypothetical protein VB137_08885 [Burkholderia sp.]
MRETARVRFRGRAGAAGAFERSWIERCLGLRLDADFDRGRAGFGGRGIEERGVDGHVDRLDRVFILADDHGRQHRVQRTPAAGQFAFLRRTQGA